MVALLAVMSYGMALQRRSASRLHAEYETDPRPATALASHGADPSSVLSTEWRAELQNYPASPRPFNPDPHLVEVASEAAVRAARPDLTLRRAIQTRGLILTARGDRAAGDFVSRFFAPSVGIDEDGVTGSAHCCLGPYWQRRL